MRALVLVAGFVVAGSALAAEDPPPSFLGPAIPAEMAGRWQGPVDQPGSRAYSVTMRLDRAGGGSTRYPELACGGNLYRLAGEGIAYREEITENRATCIDGTIRLELHSDRLDWRWYDDAGILQATARLSRP